MIGFYNVSVILTYAGLAASLLGVTRAIDGNFLFAMICLLFSGICDMFDGKVARATKRSAQAKSFGIQIDSLCDLICFAAFPAVICYCLGMDGIFGVAVLIFFVLAAVIRLGFFNVTEEARQQSTDENRKYYQGLPVTSIAILLPFIYLFKTLAGESFPIVLCIYILIVAFCFIIDIKVRKPGRVVSTAVIALGALIAIAFLVLVSKGII